MTKANDQKEIEKIIRQIEDMEKEIETLRILLTYFKNDRK